MIYQSDGPGAATTTNAPLSVGHVMAQLAYPGAGSWFQSAVTVAPVGFPTMQPSPAHSSIPAFAVQSFSAAQTNKQGSIWRSQRQDIICCFGLENDTVNLNYVMPQSAYLLSCLVHTHEPMFLCLLLCLVPAHDLTSFHLLSQ